VEKGEVEGKSLLDAMNDGAQEGMQHFDGEIEKFIRTGTVELEAGLSYASNMGNLRLSLSDYIEEQAAAHAAEQPVEKVATE
jgi:twitching motility protein PilT